MAHSPQKCSCTSGLVARPHLQSVCGHGTVYRYVCALALCCTDIIRLRFVALAQPASHITKAAQQSCVRPSVRVTYASDLLERKSTRVHAEHIAPCSAIVQSCILLGGADFLSAHGKALTDMLCTLLGNVKERGMLLLLPVMALMLSVLPDHMPSVMQPALERLLHILLTDEESTQVTAGWWLTFFPQKMLVSTFPGLA